MAVKKTNGTKDNKFFPLLIIPINIFVYFLTVFGVNFLAGQAFCGEGAFGCFGAIGIIIAFSLAFILPSVLISYLIYRHLAKVNKVLIDKTQEQKVVLCYLIAIILISLLLFKAG